MFSRSLYYSFIFPVFFAIFFLSCAGGQKKTSEEDKTTIIKPETEVVVPDFNRDSAYYFVKRQVDFGPRIPNSTAAKECALYLEKTLRRFAPEVIVQNFKARAFDKTTLSGKNIIAVFNPDDTKRILLCAHWDSRPFADHDPDPAKRDMPVTGANDGASGTGVLLEVARQLGENPPPVGVDIILFDLEDYGQPESMQINFKDDWCLGSQYWSRNQHKIGYTAKYAILLDMVGVPLAEFTKEGTSMYYAKNLVDRIWKMASQVGYGDYFIDYPSASIIDDHYYLNTIARIPSIDIIHFDRNTKSGFFPYWHTTRDDMESVDPLSLNAAGSVVLNVVYREK